MTKLGLLGIPVLVLSLLIGVACENRANEDADEALPDTLVVEEEGDLEEAAEETGEAVGEGAEEVGEAVEEGAEKVEDAVD